MSQWRREAIERLPEYHSLITSDGIPNPMSLWIELHFQFRALCEERDPPIDILRRIWHYCEWCLDHPNIDVRTAAALGFCEHILDTAPQARMIPRIMSECRFCEFRDLLLDHNSEDKVDSWRRLLWPSD